MKTWQMQEAKARLSGLIKSAVSQGPQCITHHGQAVAVVVSPKMFERLTANDYSLVDFMRRSPLYGAEDIAFERR